MSKLSPSILSANFYNLKDDIEILQNNNIEYLHLDVMDGVFVNNISFGFPVIDEIKKHNTNFIMDAHFMIIEPWRYIDRAKESGCDIFTFHYEKRLSTFLSRDWDTKIIKKVDNPSKNGVIFS